ncbi:serine/threonine-protein kinase [Agrilutibacter solisilvae]|uniref:Serine/threonine protein kinase n=1 Tax=Agrilutibacter solisilvae TaxID=2763317 RepID=A0A974Y286_9GAMM|nr:serine/threonine-protein kinase [Lysobacter solisilvae]QSX79250.1 serine/threonine protein kinase [Lysobacter solisilvae]
MDAQRWQRLSPLLDALFDLSPDARTQRLQQLHEEDPALATDLEALIALEEERTDFLAEPLVSSLGGAQPGSEIGPYRLERMLGEGGMGQVWLAARSDGLYQRRVALKLLRPGLTDTNLRLRFTRERQILARLAHPHIARLLDAGVSPDGLPYLALEYVDGEAITDYCRTMDTPLAQRLHMFAQVCDAVSHAHANLIVHRDLKPSNILVTPAGDVRLLDFGIAKLLDTEVPVVEQTRTGMRAFTLHYAAPEQIRGEPVTTMTDVYSLGVVLYELLTDRKPYRLARDSDAAWEEAILVHDAVRPSQTVIRRIENDTTHQDNAADLRRRARMLAGDLDNIVLKALSKKPEQRYPSVEALSLDLRRYEDGRPVLARPQSVGYRVRKYVTRHHWALGTAAVVTAVLAIALSLVTWQAKEALAEAARAQAMQEFMVGLFENAGGAAPGEPMDLRALLRTAEDRDINQPTAQPRTRAELLGLLARLRLGLGDYPEAENLLQRQAVIVDAGDEIPSSLLLESLTLRGRLMSLGGQARNCIDLMDPVLSLAGKEQAQLPPQVSEFYSQLGRCRRAVGERQGAAQMYERSLAIRRQSPADDVGIVENLVDMATLRGDEGKTREALQGLNSAMAHLEREVGGRHRLAIDIQRARCALHRSQGDEGSAERDCRAALSLALQLHGKDHRASIDARRQLAALYVDQGRFAQAQEEFAQTQSWLVARLGQEHREVARNYNSLGVTAWERGDLKAALVALEQAVAIWRKDDDTALLAAGMFNLAMVLHESGEDLRARSLLVEARRLRVERYGADHEIVGDTDRLLGEVQAALGEHDAARTALRSAVRLTANGYGAAHSHTLRAQVSQARLLASEGHTNSLQLLADIGARRSTDGELRKVIWLARAYSAQLRCGSEPEEARAMLDDALAQMQAALPEGGAVMREVSAIHTACAGAPPEAMP